MYTPAVALASEFWVRHRWGLAGTMALVAVFAVWCAVEPFTQTLASVHSLWFVMGLCYVIGVFAYGFEGKLETAESGFPARLFVLPVRTSILVAGPMLQGIAVAVLLWLGWERFVLRPAGIESPGWWTVMLAALVAVSQAIVWMPFGLPWVRLLAAVTALIVLIRLPLILLLAGVEYDNPDDEQRLLLAVASALIPAAYLTAWFGVVRARRGDNPDWLRAFRSIRFTGKSQRVRTPFSSPLRAQMWYEWRLRGRGFIVTVGCVLGLLLCFAAIFYWKVGWHLFDNAILLTIPLLIAPLWGAFAGISGDGFRSPRLTAFAATRPLNNAALVSAKFWAAGLTALAAWLLVFGVVGLWVVYTGGLDQLGQMWEQKVARHGRDRTVVGCAMLVAGAVLLTWRLLVAGLWAGLTGRAWVVAVPNFLIVSLSLHGLLELALWNDLARRERVLDVLPWIAGTAVALKLAIAAWAVRSLRRRGEVTTGMMVRMVGSWVAFTVALFGVTAWLVWPSSIRTYGVALGVVLIVPLARLAIAPLALTWDRTR